MGVDLVPVGRMERILERSSAKRFLQKVFSPEEIRACLAAASPAQSFAARFAAKEAFSKAIGTGFTRGVSPRGISVAGGDREAPSIILTGGARAMAQRLNASKIHLSLTHTKESACAFVVVETADRYTDSPNGLED
ncbi:holo-ACP synthase [Thermodesulfobacteriota bacterium]